MAYPVTTLLAALFLSASRAQTLPYSFDDVARLRHHILVERGLDSEVPPPQPGGVPTLVRIQLQLFKVVSVDTATSRVVLIAWQRLTWNDPRLAWNVSEWGGVTDFRVHAGSNIKIDDNIWQPNIHWYNSEAQPAQTFEMGGAWIYPNGDVYQSRPGQLQLLCRFAGLINFPCAVPRLPPQTPTPPATPDARRARARAMRDARHATRDARAPAAHSRRPLLAPSAARRAAGTTR
jgi:hypothetical protein